jgi:flagellar protein FliO/FliZ
MMAMFAAPQAVPATHVGGIGELVHVVLALLLVVAVLVLLGRLLRRTRAFGAPGAKAMEILADLPLGTKERAILMRIGSTQLLLGVAPGRVSTLHVLATPLDLTSAAHVARTDGLSFQALLRRSLGA